MTSDRRKSIFFLSLTLIIGILIGSLVPGLFGRMRHREGKEMQGREGRPGREARPGRDKKEWLTSKIIQIVKPDSAQVKEIRPITRATANQIGELEKGSNERMIQIMDSLKIKLRPILSEEQNKRLEDFSAKARQRWKKK